MARVYLELITDCPGVSKGHKEHVLIGVASLKVFPEALMPNSVAVGGLSSSVGMHHLRQTTALNQVKRLVIIACARCSGC
jgi:hypothetical protein